MLGHLEENDKVKRLAEISEGWYTIQKKEDGLYFNDLRFGLMSLNPNEERFAFSYHFVPQNTGLEVREMPRDRGDAQKLLKALWSRIWGN